MTDQTFLEVTGETPDNLGMTPRREPRPSVPQDLKRQVEKQEKFGHLLPYGTIVAQGWTESWVLNVAEVEKRQGYAVCGARRSEIDMDALLRGGKITQDEYNNDVLATVCTFKAGLNTNHPGEGRCYKHGGNTNPNAKFALLSQNSGLSKQVRDFFETEELLDLRGAIATTWAAANAITQASAEEGRDMSVSEAKEVGALMSRIGNLTKQHNEMMEKRRISIEVPEFMAWAEHFYEMAVKYILDGDKNVKGFLQEAQSYYNATVTIRVGLEQPGNSDRTSHPFRGDSDAALLGAGESES